MASGDKLTDVPATETRPHRSDRLVYLIIYILLIFMIVYVLLRVNVIHNDEAQLPLNYDIRKDDAAIRYDVKDFESLTKYEEKANTVLMALKNKEYDLWEKNNSLAVMHTMTFDEIREKTKDSQLFEMLRRMPKGVAAHIHDVGLNGIDFWMNLTYMKHLWACIDRNDRYRMFRFALRAPKIVVTGRKCKWNLVEDWRKEHGLLKVDAGLKDALTVTAKHARYTKVKMLQIKKLLKGLLTYTPVWLMYFEEAFKNFVDDGVLFMEIRTALPDLYDLDGNVFSSVQGADLIMRAVEAYRFRENANFLGANIIYTPTRTVNDSVFKKEMDTAADLKLTFGNFMAGLDFPANGIEVKTLPEALYPLIIMQDYFKYNFCNKSNKLGEKDLVNAYLLGTQRICFSYYLWRHPYIFCQFHKRGVAIIINPISNQMKKIMHFHPHPVSVLTACNIPLVISSDYPGFWNALPMTHDYYLTFMKLVYCSADIRTLKQLVFNSITYSSMSARQQDDAYNMLNVLWFKWVCELKNLKI